MFDTVDETVYGAEESGLTTSDTDIVIPDSRVSPNRQQREALQQAINPLAESENDGIELYEQTLEFVRSILQ